MASSSSCSLYIEDFAEIPGTHDEQGQCRTLRCPWGSVGLHPRRPPTSDERPLGLAAVIQRQDEAIAMLSAEVQQLREEFGQEVGQLRAQVRRLLQVNSLGRSRGGTTTPERSSPSSAVENESGDCDEDEEGPSDLERFTLDQLAEMPETGDVSAAIRSRVRAVFDPAPCRRHPTAISIGPHALTAS
eukprot:RCo034921